MSKSQQSFLSILGNDLKDRLKGNKSRANARWGLVSPPAGKSRLIWIRAGASRDSVILAAGLLAAIRHKRLDVRLVLTYEEEYQDIIVEHLSGLQKIGFGFNCANTTMVESRMLQRLSPFAIIFVGEPAKDGIICALRQNPVPHVINFQTSPVEGLETEYTLQNSVTTADKDLSVEAMSILMQAQVDTQLGALLQGGRERNIFLLAMDNSAMLKQLLRDWINSTLKNYAILCVSPSIFSTEEIQELKDTVSGLGLQARCFSQWDREQAASDNEVYIVDEWRWFAATAASSLSIHLLKPDQAQFWQSLASATVVTVGQPSRLSFELNLPEKTTQDLISYWQNLMQNPFLCRKVADENRRLFWDYRRKAQQAIDDLLQRIYDW